MKKDSKFLEKLTQKVRYSRLCVVQITFALEMERKFNKSMSISNAQQIIFKLINQIIMCKKDIYRDRFFFFDKNIIENIANETLFTDEVADKIIDVILSQDSVKVKKLDLIFSAIVKTAIGNFMYDDSIRKKNVFTAEYLKIAKQFLEPREIKFLQFLLNEVFKNLESNLSQ
jgi:transcription termination factor NusB